MARQTLGNIIFKEPAQELIPTIPVVKEPTIKPAIGVGARQTLGNIIFREPAPVEAPEPEKPALVKLLGRGSSFQKGLGSIVKFLTSAEREFGKSLESAAVAPFVTKEIVEGANRQGEMIADFIVGMKQETDPELKRRKLATLQRIGEKNLVVDPFEEVKKAVPAITKSNTQILGEAGGVLADILTLGSYGGIVAKQATKTPKLLKSFRLAERSLAKTLSVKTAEQLAFKRAALGFSYGASSAARDDKSLGQILNAGVWSGTTNIIVGAVTDTIFRRLSEVAKNTTLEQKERLAKELDRLRKPAEKEAGNIEKVLRKAVKLKPDDKINLEFEGKIFTKRGFEKKFGKGVEEILKEFRESPEFLGRVKTKATRTEFVKGIVKGIADQINIKSALLTGGVIKFPKLTLSLAGILTAKKATEKTINFLRTEQGQRFTKEGINMTANTMLKLDPALRNKVFLPLYNRFLGEYGNFIDSHIIKELEKR
jgi:hypothetical protein